MITAILPSAFAVLDAAGCEDTLGLRARLGPVRRIAVLLVDGLGYHLLDRASRSSPFLADVVAGRAGRLDELGCTLPSTTPTSLVSLGTGASPGAHGVLGFTVNVPGTDRMLTHIYWRDDPVPERWQPLPTVFARANLASTVVLPAPFVGSGLTRAAYGGATILGLGADDDLVEVMLASLRGEPGLVYGYVARVDTAAHRHGLASPEWADACARVGRMLERLVTGLPADAALLVTADHGGLDVAASARVDIGADVRLAAGIRLVGGEPRLRYLHTVPGATADVIAAWSSVLAGEASVRTREDAVATGMFGAVTPSHLDRIGDVVVTCTGGAAVLATGYEPPEVARLVGFHGSTTPVETAIPLISFVAA